MNSFSFNRFGKTLRWVLAVNFRLLLMWFVGFVLLTFVGEMLIVKLVDYNGPHRMISTFGQMGVVVLAIAAVVMASLITASMNNKRSRVNILMLPSSNLEKYLSLILYSTIISMACVVLALIVGDSLRMLWFWISGPYSEVDKESYFLPGGPIRTYYWWSSAVPELIKDLTPKALQPIPMTPEYPQFSYSMEYKVMSICFGMSFLLWVYSIYTLGGTLFRKYAFVLSSVVWILCIVLFAKTMHHFSIDGPFTSVWENDHYVGQKVNPIAYVLTVLLTLLFCFNYWASFHIFKGFQLITNKWTNYDILKR